MTTTIVHSDQRKIPVTMAVRPAPSIPCVTSSAVEQAENPEGPFQLKIHILSEIIPVKLTNSGVASYFWPTFSAGSKVKLIAKKYIDVLQKNKR